MNKFSPYIQLYLRLALGVGFLVPGLDRLGVWGKPGSPGVSWGDWQHFVASAADIMRFLPYSIASVFAVIATIGCRRWCRFANLAVRPVNGYIARHSGAAQLFSVYSKCR